MYLLLHIIVRHSQIQRALPKYTTSCFLPFSQLYVSHTELPSSPSLVNRWTLEPIVSNLSRTNSASKGNSWSAWDTDSCTRQDSNISVTIKKIQPRMKIIILPGMQLWNSLYLCFNAKGRFCDKTIVTTYHWTVPDSLITSGTDQRRKAMRHIKTFDVCEDIALHRCFLYVIIRSKTILETEHLYWVNAPVFFFCLFWVFFLVLIIMFS